jgi:hypothetical protein
VLLEYVGALYPAEPSSPASECLDWSPVNLSELPLFTDEHQQSAEVVQELC